MLNQSLIEQHHPHWDYNQLWEELIVLHNLTERLILQVTLIDKPDPNVNQDISTQLVAIEAKIHSLQGYRL